MLSFLLKHLLNGSWIETAKNRRRERAKRRLINGLLLLCAGYMIGVHRRAIWAGFTGRELPEAPRGHICRRR